MTEGVPFFPEQASSFARSVDVLYLFLVGLSGFFSLLIAGCIVGFSVRYRRKRSPRARPVEGALALEVVWTAIPLVIALATFGWGAKVFYEMQAVPVEGMRFLVTAKQWMWRVQHPTGHREINALHVPVGQKILLRMTSEDVIHSFYVPAFRFKRDVLPGAYVDAWFEATRTGTYHLFCAEYCGTKHSEMIGQVVVMEPVEYQAWLSGQPAAETPAASGKVLFEALRCNTCHSADSGQRGPPLDGLLGKEVAFTDGSSRVADEEYVRESILEPAREVVQGYEPLMPTYQGQVSEEQILYLIAYLRTLGGEAGEDRP